MAGEWKSATLEDVAAQTERPFAMGPFGSNIRAENYRASGVPVIRGLNLSNPGGPRFIDSEFVFLSDEKANELASSFAFPGDLVFVAQGTVGKVGLIPLNGKYERYVLSQNLMKVSIAPELSDSMYLFYYFCSQVGQHEILSRVNPTGVPCISKPLTSLRSFEVSLPSISEQQAIACILGTLDDKIELNRRMNQTLEAMARAIFKSWFVDFDPVRAKVEGRDLGLPKHIADLFLGSFADSELGQIPKGWEIGTLDDLLVLQRGFDLPTKNRIPGEYQVIAASGPSTYHNQAKVKGPGVVTGRSGVLGKVFLIQEDFWPLNTTLWVKKFKRSLPCHAYVLLQSIDFSLFNAGSAVPTLNRNHVHNLLVVIPNVKVIDYFESFAGPLFKKKRTNDEESVTLAAIRDALLPKLISGELCISDAERIVGRCN
jgi:type I restriction enzyme S subunit